MIIVTTPSYHFGFMYEIDSLFEHMPSYRTSNKVKNGVVPYINSCNKTNKQD